MPRWLQQEQLQLDGSSGSGSPAETPAIQNIPSNNRRNNNNPLSSDPEPQPGIEPNSTGDLLLLIGLFSALAFCFLKCVTRDHRRRRLRQAQAEFRSQQEQQNGQKRAADLSPVQQRQLELFQEQTKATTMDLETTDFVGASSSCWACRSVGSTANGAAWSKRYNSNTVTGTVLDEEDLTLDDLDEENEEDLAQEIRDVEQGGTLRANPTTTQSASEFQLPDSPPLTIMKKPTVSFAPQGSSSDFSVMPTSEEFHDDGQQGKKSKNQETAANPQSLSAPAVFLSANSLPPMETTTSTILAAAASKVAKTSKISVSGGSKNNPRRARRSLSLNSASFSGILAPSTASNAATSTNGRIIPWLRLSSNLDNTSVTSGVSTSVMVKLRPPATTSTAASTSASASSTTVPGACAICLASYRPDQRLTWSSSCGHAFHTSCLMDYATTLIAQQGDKELEVMEDQMWAHAAAALSQAPRAAAPFSPQHRRTSGGPSSATTTRRPTENVALPPSSTTPATVVACPEIPCPLCRQPFVT